MRPECIACFAMRIIACIFAKRRQIFLFTCLLDMDNGLFWSFYRLLNFLQMCLLTRQFGVFPCHRMAWCRLQCKNLVMENARCPSGVSHLPGPEARMAGGGAEEVTEGHPRGAPAVRAVHKQAAAQQDVATATASASGFSSKGVSLASLSPSPDVLFLGPFCCVFRLPRRTCS